MTFWDSSFLSHEPFFFRSGVDDFVVAVYQAAYEKLQERHEKRTSDVATRLAGAHDEETHLEASQESDYVEQFWKEQMQALGCMALASLQTHLMAVLDRAKGYFKKTHPKTRERYAGGELQNRVKEYSERFGIEVEQFPNFATLEEVVLARNDCIHREGKAGEYLKHKNDRLLDEDGDRITLTPVMLSDIVAELDAFVTALVKQLMQISAEKTTK